MASIKSKRPNDRAKPRTTGKAKSKRPATATPAKAGSRGAKAPAKRRPRAKPKAGAAALETCADASCSTAPQPQHGSFVHIDFSSPDLARAKAFYGALFGWTFHPFTAESLYFTTPGNWGPCGCLNQGAAASCQATVLNVNVNDIWQSLTQAQTLGASVVLPKTEICGGHGFIAHVRAPDGNVFGLYNRH